MTSFIRSIALASFFVVAGSAQDIGGVWQGTLGTGSSTPLRMILHIAKDDQGNWTARLQSIDQGGFDSNIAASAVSIQGSDIQFTVGAIRGTYTGKISPAGDSIKGTWQQFLPLPLEFLRPTKETEFRDLSPHTQQFVAAEPNVKIEVLDWGGSGRPLVFIPGLGNTAHVFDTFAPKLRSSYHVYGITRRGFGESSAPTPAQGTYAADRLGDDVLAVLDALKLNRPILVGHSLGGEELSSVASRHPDRVAGLVYLDAAYFYAFYDKAHGSFLIDRVYLQRALDRVDTGDAAADRKVMQDLSASLLPAVERDIQDLLKNTPDPPPSQGPPPPPPPIIKAIMGGVQKYTDIRVPVLAIFAVPHNTGQPFKDDAARAAAEARDEAVTGAQAKAIEAAIPGAKIVRLPHANHYVFRSNEADVLREITSFAESLPK
ncbi:MAG TPA: alpha/beta hydrolase [Bryobacteraceae bacterium]|nr:alpha/beta hydrolase [Bryobacteraceae bacterium]